MDRSVAYFGEIDMDTTQDVQYDYKKHMDEPVKLRLVHAYSCYYTLEFCPVNDTKTNLPIVHKDTWYPVQEYEPTLGDDEPYGSWRSRWFDVVDAADAKKKLDGFKSRIKTVGDIYHKFIERGIRAREDDMEAYRKRKEREAALPDCIE